MFGTTEKHKGQVRYIFEYSPVISQCADNFNTNIITNILKKVIHHAWSEGSDESLVYTFTDGTYRSAIRSYNTYEEAFNAAVKHNTQIIKELQEILYGAIKKELQLLASK